MKILIVDILVSCALVCCGINQGTAFGQSGGVTPFVVGLTINETGEPVIRNGWPILAAVNVTLDEQSGVRQIPLNANWISALHMAVVDTGNVVQAWPFHLVDAPAENIVLDSLTYAQAAFWLEPAEVQSISPGIYKVAAWLDSSAYSGFAGGLSGVASIPVSVVISHTSDSVGVEISTRRDWMLANMNILKGDSVSAKTYLNSILAYNPSDVATLSLLGSLLSDEGDAGSALRMFSLAKDAFYQNNPGSQEAPVELLRTEKDLLYALDTARSFVVTLGVKDSTHPFFGHGDTSCFYVDNIPYREIQFERGKTYTLHLKNIPPTDQFYFSTDLRGGGAAPYTDGVAGAPGDGNGNVSITVANSAPDTLYYQSMGHQFAGWKINIMDSALITSLPPPQAGIPLEYSLSEAYPNPFNPTTTIEYTLPRPSHVSLVIYNILGQTVATLKEEIQQGGYKEVRFSAAGTSSGVYFVRLEATSLEKPGTTFRQVRKIVLVK
jgi:hypothetical protein